MSNDTEQVIKNLQNNIKVCEDSANLIITISNENKEKIQLYDKTFKQYEKDLEEYKSIKQKAKNKCSDAVNKTRWTGCFRASSGRPGKVKECKKTGSNIKVYVRKDLSFDNLYNPDFSKITDEYVKKKYNLQNTIFGLESKKAQERQKILNDEYNKFSFHTNWDYFDKEDDCGFGKGAKRLCGISNKDDIYNQCINKIFDNYFSEPVKPEKPVLRELPEFNCQICPNISFISGGNDVTIKDTSINQFTQCINQNVEDVRQEKQEEPKKKEENNDNKKRNIIIGLIIIIIIYMILD